MRRTHLLPTVAFIGLVLAGCNGDDVSLSDPATEAVGGTNESTLEPNVGGTVPPGDDAYARGGSTGDETGDGSPTSADDTTTDGASPVVLGFDGRTVPVATTCAGADGAILATTEGEVTITLVQEDGVALRYSGEGATAETDEVAVDESEDRSVYTATLSSDQVEELTVTLTVLTDAAADLPTCE